MKRFVLVTLVSSFHIICLSQNIGIGVQSPTEKLEINGNIKTAGIILPNGKNPFDFLMTKEVTGEVGFKKGFGAVAINYIICISGNWPNPGSPSASPWLGEIKLFAGSVLPQGWVLCHGQLLPIGLNLSLFSLLGTQYGGDGTTVFALPDLRGNTPVSAGANPAGYQWTLGQKTN